jgi:hypothetical protein
MPTLCRYLEFQEHWAEEVTSYNNDPGNDLRNPQVRDQIVDGKLLARLRIGE